MAGFAMTQAFSREEARRLLRISEKQLKSWERQKLVQPATVYGFRELLALRT
jgi:DNA-binding transcriptional MerR regulator